jgi:hypothetical protein
VRVEVLVELMREERLERDEREGGHADLEEQMRIESNDPSASNIWT